MSEYKYKPGPPWAKGDKQKFIYSLPSRWVVTNVDTITGTYTIDRVPIKPKEPKMEFDQEISMSQLQLGMTIVAFKDADGIWEGWTGGTECVKTPDRLFHLKKYYPKLEVKVKGGAKPEWGEVAY